MWPRDEPRRAQLDDVPIPHVVVRHANLVGFPAVMTRRRVLRTGASRQLPRAGREVGMDVRLEDVRDADLPRGGEVEVHVDVAPRIDDGRNPGAGTADRVRVLREAFIFEAFEQHLVQA